jgi:hypothetical protein
MVAMAKKIDTSIAFLSEVERGKKPPPQWIADAYDKEFQEA